MVRGDDVEHYIQHQCHIVENMWAFAIPQYENATDTHFCAVTPLRPRNPRGRAPKMLTLEVKATDKSESYEVVEKAKLPFVSGFAVRESDEAIELNSDKRVHLLEVMESNGDVPTPLMVTTSNPDKLEVTKVSQNVAFSVYQLRVLNPTQPFDMQLQILAPSTGQKQTLPVSFRPKGSLTYQQPGQQQNQQQLYEQQQEYLRQQQQLLQEQQQQREQKPKVKVVLDGTNDMVDPNAPMSFAWTLIILILIIVVVLIWVFDILNTSSTTGKTTAAAAANTPTFTPQKSWNKVDPRTPGSLARSPFSNKSGWNQSVLSDDNAWNHSPLSGFDSTRKRR